MEKAKLFDNKMDLIYTIPAGMNTPEKLKDLLSQHPEIKFVSFVGIDLRGNDTDERIPISVFLDNIDDFLGEGVQTDGSSVVLPGIATLNNGRVDLVADDSVNWFVDYNYEFIDCDTDCYIGTLKIPSFLEHNGRLVDSRAILQKATVNFKKEVMELLAQYPLTAKQMGISPDEIEDIQLMAATELEFWVKTPDDKAEIDQLTVSQVLQEQYWKRTKGNVRTALEMSLILLEKYGLDPEMGHKEVGGVKAKIGGEGKYDHIMEQLEIDWKYSTVLQASDNELFARILIKETFRRCGLEVTFMAKPMEGISGSGEHTHVNPVAKLKNGKKINLFSPVDMEKDYLSPIGWGALMGLLKNYEAINPFITASNDAFNRLKPGFEAPICIVASIGRDIDQPSRNRTVLLGLIRSLSNPMSIRFEVRSPNPHTNTYLAIAAIYQAMLDGIRYAIINGKSSSELEKEFMKKPGEDSEYLEKDRAYRSEEDVFEYYTKEERDSLFGIPPSTVWENLNNLGKYPKKTAVLSDGDVFEKDILASYEKATLIQWLMELCERIIAENMKVVRDCVKCHKIGDRNDYDDELWNRVNSLRHYLMKDSQKEKSLFTRIREALNNEDYEKVSDLQIEMSSQVSKLSRLYAEYKRNLLD